MEVLGQGHNSSHIDVVLINFIGVFPTWSEHLKKKIPSFELTWTTFIIFENFLCFLCYHMEGYFTFKVKYKNKCIKI